MTNKSIREYINLIENAQREGVAEGSGFDKWADDRAASQLHKLKPATAWEVSYDYGPHMTKSVTVNARSEEEARAKVEKAAEKKGLNIMINSVEQGVAEGSASQIKPYSGKPEGYTFSRVQQKNYDMLVAILARNGMKFTKIDASTYPGERSYIDRLSKSTPIMLTTFKVKSPALEWHKYEGFTAGGGQNTVKVGGKKMKLTDFLRLEPKQQDALLKSGPRVAEHQMEESTPDALAKIDNLFRK